MTDSKPGNVMLWERKCKIRGKLVVRAFPAVSFGHLRKKKAWRDLKHEGRTKEGNDKLGIFFFYWILACLLWQAMAVSNNEFLVLKLKIFFPIRKEIILSINKFKQEMRRL